MSQLATKRSESESESEEVKKGSNERREARIADLRVCCVVP
jgi:hypothetical protein